MSATAKTIAGTGANVTGIGTVAWENPTRVVASDDSRVTANLGASAISNYLVASKFGLVLPASTTPTKITLEIERSATASKITHDHTIKLWKGGAAVAANKADTGTNYTGTDETKSYSWTKAQLEEAGITKTDIEAEGFGAALACIREGEASQPRVDAMWLTVEYIGPPTAIDTWLVGGQSNALESVVGNAAEATTVPEGQGYEIAVGTPPATMDGSGAWRAFAKKYYDLTTKPSGILNKCKSGSAQVKAAEAGGNGNWGPEGSLFAEAIAAHKEVATKLEEENFIPTFKGILWCQGEREGQSIPEAKTTAAAYKAGLEAMIALFRTELGPTTRFYIFRTGELNETEHTLVKKAFGEIRDAQTAVAAADANTYIVFTGAAAFAAEGKMDDNLHYSQVGYNEMGAKGAEAVVGEVDASLGPPVGTRSMMGVGR